MFMQKDITFNLIFFREIQEIYQYPASVDITPISGYLTFRQSENIKSISLQSLQDTVDEQDELFTVKLLTVNNGATIFSPDSVAMVTSKL